MMTLFDFIFFYWVLLLVINSLLVLDCSGSSWYLQSYVNNNIQSHHQEFKQRTDKFWEFDEKSKTWVQVKLPYDLVSCLDNNCTIVGSLDQISKPDKHHDDGDGVASEVVKVEEEAGDCHEVELPLRRRISLTKMSETSVWVTCESGSIYERFWNGVQWVIAPHELPISAGHAISVFIVNQTILTLSEAGILYQMQLSESSQPAWVEFMPINDRSASKETEPVLMKSGVGSRDGMRIYFCTKNGSLLELSEVEPPRWANHGRPPGANVAAIADAAAIRPEVVYTISSTGDLYEYDKSSKPSWKKHIWTEGTTEDASLLPSVGCAIHGLLGDYSVSLFLLTKGGKLAERRLNQRKWKWIIHGGPENHRLTSITPVSKDESNTLFLTSSVGSVFEYQILKLSGNVQENQIPEAWINHVHPQHAKAARGISGLQLQVGRMLFPLDDGRLGELHVPGIGGEHMGPNHITNLRRKSSVSYEWSILDAPETEGWNAEYCKEERGPANCMMGIKDETNARSSMRRRKGSQTQQDYLIPGTNVQSQSYQEDDNYKLPDKWINTNFRLRLMHGGASFFLITEGGLTFEYLHSENVWLWLKHDHSTPMEGVVGNYNGSLFLVDIFGSLLIRERSGNELAWINCTAMRRGKQVASGSPWDSIPGKPVKATTEDSLFFVSKNGRLLRFTVALRKFKWKDCRNPPDTKVASIVDQELFRQNIVFVMGRNGRLYQYNKVTEIWHEHYQSQHLILSTLPGTAMRESSSPLSLTGSLFMLSGDGGLIEYQWHTGGDGWKWIEHGSPNKDVTFTASPSPCFGNQLFLIGWDGKVYMRYMEQEQLAWRWKNCGFPHAEDPENSEYQKIGDTEGVCMDKDFAQRLEKDAQSFNNLIGNCDPRVAPTRPIPFLDDSVIFELRDGRLAEMRRVEDAHWVWARIIGTPTSSCMANYWTAVAS